MAAYLAAVDQTALHDGFFLFIKHLTLITSDLSFRRHIVIIIIKFTLDETLFIAHFAIG